MKRKTILYIAVSLDGYIAGSDDNLDFLSIVEKNGEDYGYKEFMMMVDTVIMGRKTYDWIMNQVREFPHGDMTSYIITRTPRPPNGKIHFYSGDLRDLILKLKNEQGKNIFIDGGGEIVNALLKETLIDECIISIIPILLGNGKRLFENERPKQRLTLIDTKVYDTGLVKLHYKIMKGTESLRDK